MITWSRGQIPGIALVLQLQLAARNPVGYNPGRSCYNQVDCIASPHHVFTWMEEKSGHPHQSTK